MPGWMLYVFAVFSVHLAVLIGLPESGLLPVAGRFGVGAGMTSGLSALAALAVLHRLASAVHQRGWRQGYFDGHVDGLRDFGEIWEEP